eukprot:jgi/Orpsp1_1/1180101/evm.model.c7180000072168.2
MIFYIKFLLYILLFLFKFTVILSITPISECTQGRVTGYDEYTEGGSCGFGVPKMYGAAPNDLFYNLGEQCGICYEMVGPTGTLFFMVDSHCPGGNGGVCGGDMLHFDLHRDAYKTIFEVSAGTFNVTFRMVSCDHKSNMVLKTKKDVGKYYFSFNIMYHNIGLKKVYYSYDNETWTGLNREGDYNHWTIKGGLKTLPVYFQFEAISGEKVQTTINEVIASHEYDTGVQFSVPNKFFDPFSLKEIESPKVEGCCKLNDAYTDIYYEGKYIGEWQDTSGCERETHYTENCYEGDECVKVNLVDWKTYQFRNRIKVESRRYSAIKFAIKSENECNECLKLKIDENEFIYLSTKEPGKWEEKIIQLEELGVNKTVENFRKFLFQGRKKDSQIFYFDSINLIKSDFDDQGECHSDTIQNYNLNQEKENEAISIIIINTLKIKKKFYLKCTQGRITSYDEYSNGGACGFGAPKIYGAAPNEAFYNNGEKCGICYELIGPNGVLLFMVDDYCPKKDYESRCNGDMLHFDLHRNGFKTIIDEELGWTNVTFRMVSCDHKRNMVLKTKKSVTKYYFSFVILYHNVGLKKVYYSYDNETWTGLNREGDYNHWTIKNVELPLYIQFESISGEKVQTTINEIISSHEYDTGVQFSVPNKFYEPYSLKEVKSPKVEECCKLNDAYTDIYYEGKYLGEWKDISNCEKDIEYSKNCYEGKKCVKINFKDWKVYQFYNRVKPETKRYSAIKFMMKSENSCDKCLNLKLDDYNFYSISTNEAGKWEEKIIYFKDLGLSDSKERIEKFEFQGSKKSSIIIYFDNIQLVKSDYVDKGICHANTLQNINVSQGSGGSIDDKNLDQEDENKANQYLDKSFIKFIVFIFIIVILI